MEYKLWCETTKAHFKVLEKLHHMGIIKIGDNEPNEGSQGFYIKIIARCWGDREKFEKDPAEEISIKDILYLPDDLTKVPLILRDSTGVVKMYEDLYRKEIRKNRELRQIIEKLLDVLIEED